MQHSHPTGPGTASPLCSIPTLLVEQELLHPYVAFPSYWWTRICFTPMQHFHLGSLVRFILFNHLFLCGVLWTIVCLRLAFALSHFQFMTFDYPFGSLEHVFKVCRQDKTNTDDVIRTTKMHRRRVYLRKQKYRSVAGQGLFQAPFRVYSDC